MLRVIRSSRRKEVQNEKKFQTRKSVRQEEMPSDVTMQRREIVLAI